MIPFLRYVIIPGGGADVSGGKRTNVLLLCALCAFFTLLFAVPASALSLLSADGFSDAQYIRPACGAGGRAPAREPARAHYVPPRHELAGYLSFDCRARTRLSEFYGGDKAACQIASAAERRFRKDAENASREAMRHTYTAYVARSVREVTEGGKNVFNEPDLLMDWRDALRPILPH
jgi:hypothetical protein